MNRTLFCETVDGRGFIARVLGENYAAAGRLALYADDNPQSVEWFQVRHIYTSIQSGTTISVNICTLVLKYLQPGTNISGRPECVPQYHCRGGQHARKRREFRHAEARITPCPCVLPRCILYAQRTGSCVEGRMLLHAVSPLPPSVWGLQLLVCEALSY